MTDTATNRDLQTILADADGRWQRHTEVLGWLRDQRVRGPERDFSAAQELGHHAHWIEYALAHNRARIEGTPTPAPVDDEDIQNDAWAAEDAALTYDAALARATAAREAYRDVFVAAAEQRPDESRRYVDGLDNNLVGHFDQHFGYLVQGALARESVEWERLTAYLDARPEGVLHTGEDGVAWRASDIYAHLGRWMTVNIPRVEAFLADGVLPELGATDDELNPRWIEADRDRSFADTRRDTFLARDRFMAQMRSIPLDRWTARLFGLYDGNSAGHYQEHLGYIEG